ncbi:MAG: hypothetical protein H6652_16425 [Ardenticatenaceae bacterium]|nr:hypothetical protein [Ardenticatenaceae bacterium]MCB8948897.1 hypothetical protein [Ardenticatenaceae bacterium]
MIMSLPNPKTKSLNTTFEISEIPEITNLEYDLWELRITLKFPNKKEPIYVIFSTPVGFRVLDESDMTEYWNDDARSSGWLWEIVEGGWITLETQRKNKYFSGTEIHNVEYLVTGIHDCINVISPRPPKIYSG